MARTKWISVFLLHAKEFGVFHEGKGKRMTKSMTGVLNIAPLVTVM